MSNADSSPVQNEITDKIIAFIQEIGIEVRKGEISEETFLPGIKIEEGELLVDIEKLVYPGDLIHEAGHIALEPKEDRSKLNGDLDEDKSPKQSLEIGVILWSWAALTHLDLDPKVVFHEAGYKGASDWHIQNFSSGNYIGLPLLQWMGLCKQKDDTNPEIKPFPHMVKWTRD